MRTSKTKPTQPAAAPAAESKEPELTALLMECFEFDNSAAPHERQLLLDMLRLYRSGLGNPG